MRDSGLLQAIVFLFACIFPAVTVGQQPSRPMVTPVREADAICGKCHGEILRSYLSTPMANASGLASERPILGSFYHTQSDTAYRISAEENSLWLSYQRPRDPSLKERHKLDYFLGSGHLGVTYLYSLDGYLLESPIAYYSNLNAYDMKPGLANSPTVPAALPMPPGCMRCHMSDVQREDPATRNHYQGLPFLHGGITCESCHGDTREHISTAGRAAVINPVKLDPERRDSICINCHLEGDTSVEHRGRLVADYKPGERIEDYVSYFVYSGPEMTSRGVSEIEELSVSKCKRASGDRMSCMSCHDPHYSPPAEARATFYRNKCLACHTQAKYLTAHYPNDPDCTRCHMPTGKAENIPHVAWTDHRIRQHPDQPTILQPVSALQPAPANSELISFLHENTSQRDLAIAYYNMFANGTYSAQERAWQLLLKVEVSEPSDPTVLADLGYLEQSKGKISEAMDFYQKALKLDPTDLPVVNNLGSLKAQSGQLKAAVILWEKAFKLNEDIESLGINLALAECRLGQLETAVNVLQRVLIYSPDSSTAKQRLRLLASGQETCSAK